MNFKFELMELFGKIVLFINWRIKLENVPEGLHRYELRHDDRGELCEICDSVFVDHFGTILSKEPIGPLKLEGGSVLTTQDGIDITIDDYQYTGFFCTVEDYMGNYDTLCQEVKDGCIELGINKYRVDFHGSYYIVAPSREEAAMQLSNIMDGCQCTYSDVKLDGVVRVKDFVFPMKH